MKTVRQRVKEITGGFAETAVPLGEARSSGRAKARRIRFGDCRLVCEVHATEIVVFVSGVARRKEVFKRLLRRR